MDNNLSKNKKRFSKEGAIIGGIVGVTTGFLSGWLKNEFGLSFLTRTLIIIIIAIFVGGIASFLIKSIWKNKQK